MPQTSISRAPAIGFAGQIAEPGAPTYCRSCTAEGSGVVAGAPVKRGTDPQRQVTPFEAGDIPDSAMFAGVVVLETSRPFSDNGIKDGDPVTVMRLGSILMDFSEAVTAGEQVAIELATGKLKGYAQGTSAASIPTGEVVLPGLRIAETTSAAGLATVEVNLFGAQDAATVGTA